MRTRSLRYVRQEDDLWQSLHAGVLTTGRLNQALGLRETMAAHAIDGPKVSNSLHEAFSHLLTAPWQPDPPRGPSGADATAHNEAARLRFNEDLEGLGGLGEGWEESGERSFREEAGAHNFASICSACRPCEHDR